jgi:hypothetical protein
MQVATAGQTFPHDVNLPSENTVSDLGPTLSRITSKTLSEGTPSSLVRSSEAALAAPRKHDATPDNAVAHTTTRSPRRKGPSDAEWEAVKDILEAKYYKRTLLDIMKYMEKKHSFVAGYVYTTWKR